MEKQIFTWEMIGGEHRSMLFHFYDITLSVDLSPYKKGDKFAVAALDYADGTIELFRHREDEEPCYMGNLALSVAS